MEKTLLRFFFCTFCLIGVALSAKAQKFVYDLDFLFYFDNREYHSPYSDAQTLLGARLSPEIGVSIDDNTQGLHRLMAGAQYCQPLNKNFLDAKLMPTLYYQYKKKGYNLHFGAVPYRKLMHTLPEFYLSDSINYAHPNLYGALVQITGKRGFLELYCDWYGLQSRTTREAFQLMVDGEFRAKVFYAGGYISLTHLANKAAPEPRLGVCEKFSVNPLVGINLSPITPLDSFTVQAGYIFGYNRERETATQHISHGVHADIYLQWRFLALRNNFFYGNNFMPFFKELGAEFHRGNPFFQSKIYNRTDLIVYLFRKDFVECRFAWNIHYTPNDKIGHQQQIILQFNLGKALPKK